MIRDRKAVNPRRSRLGREQDKGLGGKCAECTKELHPLRLGEVRAGSQGCDQGVLL